MKRVILLLVAALFAMSSISCVSVFLSSGFDTGSSQDAEVSTTPNMPNQEAPASDFLYVKSSNNEITIRSYSGKDTCVVIPSKIEGCYVTKITEKAFFGNDNLVAVSLPSAINKIGAEAFADCDNLSWVYFPKEQLRSLVIGEQAFSSCNLKGTLIINSLKLYISNHCFHLNYELEKIYLVSEDIVFGDSPFAECKSITDIYMSANANTTYEARYANSNYGDVFENMESLERVFMPSSCAFLNEETFQGCPKVTVYGKKGADVLSRASDCDLPVNFNDYDFASTSIIDEIIGLGYSF